MNQIDIIHLRRVYKLTYLHTHFMNKLKKNQNGNFFLITRLIYIYIYDDTRFNITSEKTKGQVSLS